MKSSSFRRTLVADLRMWKLPVDEHTHFFLLVKHTLFQYTLSHGFACVFWYRLNRVIARTMPRVARLIWVWRYYTFANDISYLADIGPGFMVCHTSDIVIGVGVTIGARCTIFNGVTLGSKYRDRTNEKPSLGNDVVIGTGAKVLGNITIGDGVTIGALTFCDKSVPANHVARGNPMVIVPSKDVSTSESSNE